MTHRNLNSKQAKTLRRIFDNPTRSNIRWNDVTSLFQALGGDIDQRSGSRIMVTLPTTEDDVLRGHFHEPHGKHTPKSYVEEARRLLEEAGHRP